MNELLDSIDGLAMLIEAANKKKRRKILLVAAFSKIGKNGKPSGPLAVSPGDDLYLAKTEQPGAGTISRDPSGRPFAASLDAIAAGVTAEIATSLYLKRWVTDGNPCAICDENALAGWIPVDEDFPSGDEEPDAHPNCFLGETPVVAFGVSHAIRRWYEGEVCVLRIAGLPDLSVTPNHPILTRGGWVAAGALKPGEDVAQCVWPADATIASGENPYDNHVEASIEQVFESLLEARGMVSCRVPLTAEAFHGDTQPDAEVDIVRAAGAVRDDIDIVSELPADELPKNLPFRVSERRWITLDAKGLPASILDTSDHAAHGVMSGSGVCLPQRLGRIRHSDVGGGAAIALREAETVPLPQDRGTRDADAAGNSEQALTSQMIFVEVLELQRRQFAGHVYNLQTESGIYFAGTIVAHNCKCSLITRRASDDEED